MARSRTTLIAIVITIVTIIVSVIVELTTSQTSSWSSVILVVVLLSIVTLGFGIFQVLGKAYEVREKRTQEQPRPIKITLEIDGEPITIETSGTDRVKEVLKLVQDLQANHSSNVNDGRQR